MRSSTYLLKKIKSAPLYLAPIICSMLYIPYYYYFFLQQNLITSWKSRKDSAIPPSIRETKVQRNCVICSRSLSSEVAQSAFELNCSHRSLCTFYFTVHSFTQQTPGKHTGAAHERGAACGCVLTAGGWEDATRASAQGACCSRLRSLRRATCILGSSFYTYRVSSRDGDTAGNL